MGTGADDTAGIGTEDHDVDPVAAPDGDSGGALTINVESGTDDGTAGSGDSGRAVGSGGRAGKRSGGTRRTGTASSGVRSAGSGKRTAGKRKSASARGTREATLRVDQPRASRAARKASAIPAQALGDLVGVTFQLVASRRGPHWQLRDEESAQWGTALANVLRHVPLPERELGIAADIAALGFVAYATVESRLAYERQAVGAARRSPVPPAPAAPPHVAATATGIDPIGLERARAALADRLNGEPLDFNNPEHVRLLNEIANEPIVATGDAVGIHTAPVYPDFDPERNGAHVNDPGVIES